MQEKAQRKHRVYVQEEAQRKHKVYVQDDHLSAQWSRC